MALSSLFVVAVMIVGCLSGAASEEHCDDKFLCVNKPKNYDTFQPKIDKIIAKNEALISKSQYPMDDHIVRTTGDDENCKAETTIEKPFVIKTNVSAEYVVQSELFEQKIKVTRCQKPSANCFNTVKPPGFGTTATCEEKLGYVSLYVYDAKRNEFRYQHFEVPICCVCRILTSYKK